MLNVCKSSYSLPSVSIWDSRDDKMYACGVLCFAAPGCILTLAVVVFASGHVALVKPAVPEKLLIRVAVFVLH